MWSKSPWYWIVRGSHHCVVCGSTAQNFLKNLLAIRFKNLSYLEDASKSPFRDLHFRITILAVGICFSPRFELSVMRNLQTHFLPSGTYTSEVSTLSIPPHQLGQEILTFFRTVILSTCLNWSCPCQPKSDLTLSVSDTKQIYQMGSLLQSISTYKYIQIRCTFRAIRK